MKRCTSMELHDIFKSLLHKTPGSLAESNTEPPGTQLANPFKVTKYESTDLVELARGIQKADVTIRATVCSKLQMIAEQVHFLQQQAHKVLLEANENLKLHHAACNFHKIPGHIYHLYERSSGQQYFSMLSPEDWYSSHGGPPHVYIGAYRLEHDLSWTSEVSDAVRTNQMSLVNDLFIDEDMQLIKSSDLDHKASDTDMQ